MHWRTKQKLINASKLYIIEPEADKTIEIRIQFSNNEYTAVELNQPFPKKVYYKSLEFGGFNYNPRTDTAIYRRNTKDIIRILKNSIGYRYNNTETINKTIDLISLMHIHN